MASSVEGILDGSYLAPNTFMVKRDIRKRIFPRYREDTLFDFLFHSGKTKETLNTRFNWFEHDFLYSSVIIETSTGTTGAGNTVTITIEEASHQETGKKSPGKPFDLVWIQSIRGWIESTNKTVDDNHVYTIKPVRSTDDIVTVSTATTVVAIFSNAKADGTGQPESMIRKPNLFFNFTQIFSTQYETFGSESANQVEFEIDGKPYFYLLGVEDAANKHNLDMDFNWLIGEQSLGLVDANSTPANEPVNTSRGLDSYVTNFGNDQTYTTFDFADLTSIEKTLSRERAPMEMMWMNGVNLDIDIDAVIKGKMDNSGVRYEQFGKGDAQQRAVDFGFDSFRFSQRSYHKRAFDFMNYLPVTGIAGSPFPDNGYVIPLDRIRNPKPIGENDEEMDTITLRFKRNDRVNRFVKHWTRDVTITNNDRLEFNHLSEAGLQFAMLNQAIKVHK